MLAALNRHTKKSINSSNISVTGVTLPPCGHKGELEDESICLAVLQDV